MFFWSCFARALGSSPDDTIIDFEIAGLANCISVYNYTTDAISNVPFIHISTRKGQIAQKTILGSKYSKTNGHFFIQIKFKEL